jgi:indolepyruvate ferredoxin oxidoreductase
MDGWWPRLARLKWLRGTPFDPFGYTAERKAERRMIREYERDMAEVLADPGRHLDAAVALAELPLSIRGFGPVKEAAARKAAERREDLLAEFRAGSPNRDAALAS